MHLHEWLENVGHLRQVYSKLVYKYYVLKCGNITILCS